MRCPRGPVSRCNGPSPPRRSPMTAAGRRDGGPRPGGDNGGRGHAGTESGAAGASAALHGGHLRPRRGSGGSPFFPSTARRARRAIHLPRPRPAHRLRHARSQSPQARRCAPMFGVCALEDWVIATLDVLSTSRASAARAGSAYGSPGPTSRAALTEKWRKTRSPPSACACAAG